MTYNNITDSLTQSINTIWMTIAEFAPRFLSAIFLLVVGYLIAKCISKVVKLALNKADINNLSEKVGLSQILVSCKCSPDLSNFISKICFYFIFLIFLISTADVLELEGLSSTVDKLLLYIPNVIGALFVFFLASIAAHFAREAMNKAGDSLQIDFSNTVANVLYYSILLIGLVLAISQLKIETEFLTHIIEIIVITTGVAVALSVGIGSRDVSKNLISGVYLKDSFSEGAVVKLGDYEGTLVAIKPVCFELKTTTGMIITFPNSRILDCEIIQQA